MNSSHYVAIPTSGLSIAVARELLIPDPPSIAKGVEIIEHGTNEGTTGNDPESN
jgi:hypothetical protein